MTKKTDPEFSYLCHMLHRSNTQSYKESWCQLKKGNPGHLIKNTINTIIRILNKMYFLNIIFWYPSIFRHHLVKLMGSHATGIDHITCDLVDLIKQSVDLNSTAIIFPFKIHPRHNLGKECDSTPDIYYNLSDSYYVTPAGEKKKIRHIHAKDFLKMRNYYRVRSSAKMKQFTRQKKAGKI